MVVLADRECSRRTTPRPEPKHSAHRVEQNMRSMRFTVSRTMHTGNTRRKRFVITHTNNERLSVNKSISDLCSGVFGNHRTPVSHKLHAMHGTSTQVVYVEEQTKGKPPSPNPFCTHHLLTRPASNATKEPCNKSIANQNLNTTNKTPSHA